MYNVIDLYDNKLPVDDFPVCIQQVEVLLEENFKLESEERVYWQNILAQLKKLNMHE